MLHKTKAKVPSKIGGELVKNGGKNGSKFSQKLVRNWSK